MWVIYSIGDSHFLATVINAVAMVFNSHLPDSLAAIGLLLGILYQGLKGTSTGLGISWGQVLGVFLIYLLFFVPKTSVELEDVYTSEVRVVDGVPLGAAAAGSIISTIGHAVTGIIGNAFATPSATDRGFASALVLISQLRENLAGLAKLKSVNETQQGNFEESWINYFKECTLIGVDIGTLKIEEIFRAENLLQAVRFDSRLYGTAINTGGGLQNLTCSDAYQSLTAFTQVPYKQALEQELNKAISSEVYSPEQLTTDKLSLALTSLGISNISAQDYALNVLLLPLYEQAAINKYSSEQNYNAAIMLNEALASRNTQWAVEQTMFFTVIRPMLTFFEALVFAITPFMAFVVVLGLGGPVMLGRYLAILVWIELWQPLLSIINLYILEAVSGELAALGGLGGSFSGIMSLHSLTAEYLSVGGMLAAGVPALALMIVYGGAVAATSLVSRLGGQDHIQEQMAVPSISKSAPVLDNAPAFSNSAMAGVSKTGAKGFLPELSLSAGFDKARQEAQASVESSEAVFAQSLSANQAHMLSKGLTNTNLQQTGMRIASSNTRSAALVNNSAKQIANRLGLDSSQEEAVKGAVSSIFNGSSLSSEGLAELALAGSSVSSDRVATSKLASELTAVSHDEALRADYNQALASEISSGVVESLADTSKVGESSALVQSAKEAVAAREELSFVMRNNSAIAGGHNIDGLTISRRLAENGELLNKLGSYGNIRSEVATRANELMPLMKSLIPDPTQAYAASMLTAMLEKDPQNAFRYMLEASGLGSSELNSTIPKASASSIETSLVDPIKAPSTTLGATKDPEEGFREASQKISEGFSSNKAQGQAELYESILKTPIAPASFMETAFGASSSVEAEKLAKGKGLTPVQERVFLAFAQGTDPTSADLKELRSGYADEEVYNGVVARLQLGASSGKGALLDPIVGLNRAKR